MIDHHEIRALISKVSLKSLKKLFDYIGDAQALIEKSHCSYIWYVSHHSKANKLLEGTAVIYLEFKLCIA